MVLISKNNIACFVGKSLTERPGNLSELRRELSHYLHTLTNLERDETVTDWYKEILLAWMNQEPFHEMKHGVAVSVICV